MKWIQFRHLLHECAELSGSEWKTREVLFHELKHHKGELIACTDSPSLMMFYDYKADSTVMIRAEMDGLGIQEENTFSYVSKTEGVMHACGHDGHMSILCALSSYLSEMDEFPVNVLLVFQSSEETGAGALKILGNEQFLKYCPDKCVALHVMPQMEKGFYTKEGVICAGSREIDAQISAEAGHSALRKEDALMKAVYFLKKLFNISYQDGFASFHVCKAGEVRNQNAQRCSLEGTMRFLSHGTEKELIEKLNQIKPQDCDLHFSSGYPVLYNHGKVSQCALECGCRKLEEPLWISDDFAFYAQRIPSVYILMGIEANTPLHHPCFDFDDKCIENGVEFLLKLLKECQKH